MSVISDHFIGKPYFAFALKKTIIWWSASKSLRANENLIQMLQRTQSYLLRHLSTHYSTVDRNL